MTSNVNETSLYTEDEQDLADYIVEAGGTPIVFTVADTDKREREILLAWHLNMLEGRTSLDRIQQNYADAQVYIAHWAGRVCEYPELLENHQQTVRICERFFAHLGVEAGNKVGVYK